MSYKAIKDELETLLTGIEASTDLNETFRYPKPVSDEYPYAQILTGPANEILMDTGTNETVYVIDIVVSDSNKDRSVMEERMEVIIDAILAELRKKVNCTLSGITMGGTTYAVVWGFAYDKTTPLRQATITCNFRVASNLL
jgi:hypothetical protein